MLLVKGLPSGMTARVAPVMALWMHTGAGNWEGKHGGVEGGGLKGGLRGGRTGRVTSFSVLPIDTRSIREILH